MPLNKSPQPYAFTTKFHDIDAAGVVFYARFFYYAHDAYEELLESQGNSIKSIISSGIILPIKQTQASFKAPISLNEKIIVKISVIEILETEFTLTYNFLDIKGKEKALLTTQHICLDMKTRKRTPLAGKIIKILNA